jgi:hypothetical protein
MSCNRELGFVPDALILGAIEPAKDGFFMLSGPNQTDFRYKKCQNYAQESVCNWMIPGEDQNEVFCKSCRLTGTIPNLTSTQNRALWALMEIAKRRLIYSLINLKLPILSKREDAKRGLTFRFLSNVVNPNGSTSAVLTGHDDGVITMNIDEADDAFREKTRLAMNEPYRTLLGHFRHESGHYYWDRLVRNTQFLEPFRALFGDERPDYLSALKAYYAKGSRQDWRLDHVSAYSTAHPWEDWAETWAHFMHIHDTLEVADDFGLKGKTLQQGAEKSVQSSDGAKLDRFDRMIEDWLDLSVALNSINRSMGHHDLYPFVLTTRVIEKLRFVSEVISGRVSEASRAATAPRGA